MGAENKEGCRYLNLHSPPGAVIGPGTTMVSSLDIEKIKYGKCETLRIISDTTLNQTVKIFHV